MHKAMEMLLKLLNRPVILLIIAHTSLYKQEKIKPVRKAAHTYNPSIREVEQEDGKFEVSLRFKVKSWLKNTDK